ncbi:hypothetical protein Cpir12675_006490 [Ceratocystis pirilliformis]|uniref:Uncharacterized protein n=1 Tax=Ceratocystis pirilliformis TaxID=259994 RepID=A0ABR3YIB9_9PEZI
MPKDVSDERVQSRVHQVLHKQGDNLVITAAIWAKNPDFDSVGTTTTGHETLLSPFVNEELSAFWNTALQNNGRYWQARSAVKDKARMFSNDWGLPWQIA